MKIYNKLNRIRVPNQTTSKQKFISITIALMIGAFLGLFAKIADYPYFINWGFTDIADRLGIWVFMATLLSVFSPSPKLAGVKVFTFFIAVLSIYYLYTALFLGFFSAKAIIFWSVCAAVTPVCLISCGMRGEADSFLMLFWLFQLQYYWQKGLGCAMRTYPFTLIII